MSSVALVEATRASMPVPPLRTHSESGPSEKTRLRNRLKYSSRMRSLVVRAGSYVLARFAAALMASSTPLAVAYGSDSSTEALDLDVAGRFDGCPRRR